MIPPVDDAYELYWNGAKIGNLGTLPPRPVWYAGHRQSFALPYSPSEPTTGLLAIRVWKAPLNSTDPETEGGLNAAPVLGDTSVIAEDVGRGDLRHLRGALSTGAITCFFLMIGLVSFFAWARHRKRTLYLWFAMWLLGEVARNCISIDLLIGSSSANTYQLELILFYSIANCSMFLLLLHLLNLQDDRRLRRWTWTAIAINVGLGVADGLVLLDWANAALIMQWLDAVLTSGWALSELFVFVLVYQGFRHKLDLARQLVAVMAFLVYLFDVITVASVQGRRFTHWTLYEQAGAALFNVAGSEINVRLILQILFLVSLVYALMHYAMEQRRHTEAIERELESAREVQQVMIPEALPEVPGYAIDSVYQSATEVGGDFFQIIPLEDYSTLVILGDVSGKGLKAAMNVALIVGTLRTLTDFDSDPAAVLTGLNRRLVGRLQGGFATTVVLRLTPLGDCTLANAGHLPPFLNSSEMTLGPSLPLGIDADAAYENTSIALHDEDRLTLYTDGVLEATNPEGELYGFERVSALLSQRPAAEFIAKTAHAFGQEDDITVLTITRLSVSHPIKTASMSLSIG